VYKENLYIWSYFSSFDDHDELKIGFTVPKNVKEDIGDIFAKEKAG